MLTIDSQIPQSGARSALDFRIMATEEEEHGVECVPSDLTDLFLSDLSKGERSATLEVDVLGER